MNKILKWLAALLSIGMVAAAVVWLPAVLQDTTERMARGQAVSPIETPTVPTPTAPLLESPTPTVPVSTTLFVEPPTTTPPPVPTPLPTPVVTPVPVAEPPFIPLPGGVEATPREVYTLLVREDDVLRTISSDGTGEKLLVDVRVQVPLYLGRRSAGIMPFQWGQVSPDGTQLALVLTNSPEKNKSTTYSIYLYDTTSQQMKLLVESGDKPIWSPDGARLAYRDIRIENYGLDVTYSLKIVELATAEVKEVVTVDADEAGIDFFTWSPDGRHIAFTRTVAGYVSPGEVWTADVTDGSEPVQITSMEMLATRLNWSPAGDKILFLSNRGEHVTVERPMSLWTVEVATKELRQLTQHTTISGGEPVWSPDGAWIAFTGTNMLESEESPYDLWLVGSDGSALRRLTQDPASDLYPAWVSARQIVFLKRDSEMKQDNGIWEVDLVSGTFRVLFPQDREFKILR